MSALIVTVTDAPSPEARAVVSDGFDAYNRQQAGYWDGTSPRLLVADPATEVVGGLTGRTLAYCFIGLVHLPDRLRG